VPEATLVNHVTKKDSTGASGQSVVPTRDLNQRMDR
jgi:hypothetical protein